MPVVEPFIQAGGKITSSVKRLAMLDDAIKKRRNRTSGSFSSKDSNGDGQIQLSEFTSQFDRDSVDEFNRIDTDGNGVISVEEWNNK